MGEDATRPEGVLARARAESIGRYRIERELGEGGMARVYLAVDRDLERKVALKLLQDRDDRARLVREARAMARLSHPNVVAVYEVGRDGDRDYVAMELVDGDTLAAWLKTEPPIPAILDAFVAAGRGLAAAHDAGIVHRDFKPHNVLRAKDGRVLVTDFGLAREQATDTQAVTMIARHAPLAQVTAENVVAGTPAYMPPEQWGGGAVSPATDQFAFCVALWEAIAGARPFDGDSEEALRLSIEAGPRHAGKLPRWLRPILARGLDPRPSRRWPTLDALLTRIAQARRRPIVLAVGGGALAIAGVAYVALAMRGGSEPCVARTPPDLSHAEPAIADKLTRELTSWQDARAAVCSGERHPEQLVCLDGVLDHIASVRDASDDVVDLMFDWLVDPERCASDRPPRVTQGSFPAMPHALELLSIARRHPIVEEPPHEPCAGAVVRLAIAIGVADDHARRLAYGDASDAAAACGDDRLSATVALAIATAALERQIDADADREVTRADAAASRIPQLDVDAEASIVHARRHEQYLELDDAIRDLEPAIDKLARRGRDSSRRRALLQLVEDLVDRSRPEDYAQVRAIAAREQHDPGDAPARFAIADGFARLALGDVRGGHDEIRTSWQNIAHEHSPREIPTEGTVVDGGKPVAGAEVTAAPNLLFDSIGMIPSGQVDPALTTTDANGHFAFRALPNSVIVASHGDRRSRPTPIGTPVIELEATRTITGHVALGTTPAASTFVNIRFPDDLGGRFRIYAPVSPEGAFTASGVSASTVSVFAGQDQAAPLAGGRAVELAPGAMTANLTLEGNNRYKFKVVVISTEPPVLVYVAIASHFRNDTYDSASLGAIPFHSIDTTWRVNVPDELSTTAAAASSFDVAADELSACVVALTSMPSDMADREVWLGVDHHLTATCVPVMSPRVVVTVTPQKWPN